MNPRRKYERRLYKCPEIDCYDVIKYPLVSEERFLLMEDLFKTDESTVHIFPFVCKNPSEDHYIDIYIWDIAMYQDGISFRRFLICENYRLSEEDEDLLFNYLNGSFLSWEINEFYDLSFDIQGLFPEWHLIQYTSRELSQMLAHCYFASHHCGPRETLFKSLPHIGYNIDKLPSFNMLGTNPVSIVGFGLPLRLLRILDENPDLLCKLFCKKSIETCRKAYLKYSGYINGKRIPTKAQYDYLEDLVTKGRFSKYGFNRTIYCRLGRGDIHHLDMYADFLYLRDRVAEASLVPEVRKMEIPCIDEVERIITKLRLIADCSELYKEEDQLIKTRNQKEGLIFEWHDEKYSILMPDSVVDFYKEGIIQGNCLVSENYVTAHAHDSTTVAFLRRNNRIDDPFVTIEIKSGDIIQVRGRFNSLPGREVFEILEKYSEERSIAFNPYRIISESVDDLYEIDDEDLQEYIESHKPIYKEKSRQEISQMIFEGFKRMLSTELSDYEITMHDEKGGE